MNCRLQYHLRTAAPTGPLLAVCWLMLLAWPAPAGTISLDRECRALQIEGFPEDAPATADDLRAWEEQNQTGTVGYDAPTDTCAVNASLWIGREDVPETFFQLGRAHHPRERLQVRGNVWVRPSKIFKIDKSAVLKRSDGRLPFVNRLSVGSSNDPAIHAVLMIACETNGQYGVKVGDAPAGKFSGELHLYNSTLTAAVPEPGHQVAPAMLFGSDIRLVNAELSRIDRFMAYGINTANATVRGTTFTQGGFALCNGVLFAQDCTFRDVEGAVVDYGGLDATLVNCVFENNRQDWVLGGGAGIKIMLIDCALPDKSRFSIRKNSSNPELLKRSKAPLYPACEQWRSLTVTVRDVRGRPIAGAVVNVIGATDPSAVRNAPSFTDATGTTPAAYAQKPILVMTRKITATDTPDQPAIIDYFRYAMRATAPGYDIAEQTLSAAEAGRPVVFALRRSQ